MKMDNQIEVTNFKNKVLPQPYNSPKGGENMSKNPDNTGSTDSKDAEKSDGRRLIGQGGQALERLSDFLEREPDIDEQELKNECGDLIVSISGMSCIYANRFYDEFPDRAVPVSPPKVNVKLPKEKLVDSERKGLLLSNIKKAEKLVEKLKTQKASLEKDLERSSDYVEKKRLKIKLQNVNKSFSEAEVKLQDWKDRLDHLVDGSEGHSEEES